MELFNGKDIDWAAYAEGQAAYTKYLKTGKKIKNPYPAHCDKWYSWNKGWNS